MPLQMLPALPQFNLPNTGTDIIGLALTLLTLLMGALATSEKARQTAQAVFNFYKFARLLINNNRDQKKPAAATVPTNGNGHTNGNGNGNGNGASDTLRSVMQTLRAEQDARELSYDLLKAEQKETKERVRRDVDNLYIAVSDVSRDNKLNTQDIVLLKADNVLQKAEIAKVQAQMIGIMKEQTITNERLQTILHILQPPPTPPGKTVIPLSDDDDLEAVG